MQRKHQQTEPAPDDRRTAGDSTRMIEEEAKAYRSMWLSLGPSCGCAVLWFTIRSQNLIVKYPI
jgi:hypothetical protein